MSPKMTTRLWAGLLLLLALLAPLAPTRAAAPPAPAPAGQVTAYDLIIAMNTLRVSNGLPALIEDPIVNAVAQATAEIMAINQMSCAHRRCARAHCCAGYGSGDTVWATGKFRCGQT